MEKSYLEKTQFEGKWFLPSSSDHIVHGRVEYYRGNILLTSFGSVAKSNDTHPFTPIIQYQDQPRFKIIKIIFLQVICKMLKYIYSKCTKERVDFLA